MMVTRIYADKHGESHFSEVDLPLTLNVPAQGIDPIRTSPRIAATHIQFLTAAPALITDKWHPAPARQFAIVLKGALIVEVSNGQSRKLEPGSFLFVEDTWARATRTTSSTTRRSCLRLFRFPTA